MVVLFSAGSRYRERSSAGPSAHCPLWRSARCLLLPFRRSRINRAHRKLRPPRRHQSLRHPRRAHHRLRTFRNGSKRCSPGSAGSNVIRRGRMGPTCYFRWGGLLGHLRRAAGVNQVTMRSTSSRINSAANSGRRLTCPWSDRYSYRMFCPST